MNIEACLTKNSDNWQTPKEIYNFYVNKQNFFDPCPYLSNFDGLKITWKKYNFVNPPYSQLKQWIEKAIYEMKKNDNCTLLLIPARTDTQAFKMLMDNKAIITFIIGRLKFSQKNYAPFPSMLVYLDNMNRETKVFYKERQKLFEYYKNETTKIY